MALLPWLARFSNRPDGERQQRQWTIKTEEGNAMGENREIDDDELVEITGAGEFDVFDDETDYSPTIDPAGGAGEADADSKQGGDQAFDD